jgi:hypothetical protein
MNWINLFEIATAILAVGFSIGFISAVATRDKENEE